MARGAQTKMLKPAACKAFFASKAIKAWIFVPLRRFEMDSPTGILQCAEVIRR